ncbi:hypothetical protein WR25_22898 isoform B [Diploscapter pachys]|uniref:Major facilitator superfamily (MFS) profile domain-containing protein n=1 Tax=Diploscapter pachys TaxID=2018661 RepID=A0A2A2KTF4_9BILA|nr:hypothetical protein WR25_22898 isoform A [Diploscapter pachys]PAV77277.1 hypothetical protein WR25_22898 isoform B [Diploscapter pachys]
MANINAFNFTILCMPGTSHLDEETLSMNQTMYVTGFTRSDKTLIYSAVAIGSLLAVVPISLLISKSGCRKVFFACGLLSAIATCGIPFVAADNLMLFLVMRFLQGAAFASCMPTAGAATASWAPIIQHGFFISTFTTFPILGSVIAMPVAGILCTSPLGWKAVYFLLTGFTLFVFGVWVVLFRDYPENHKLVNKSELLRISHGKNLSDCSKSDEKDPVPYGKIVLTPSILGVCIGAIGDFLSIQLIHVFSPIYIRNVLQYSVHETGFAAGLPVFLQLLVKIFGGLSSDLLRCMSETTKLRIFNTISMWVSGAFLLSLAFVNQGEGLYGMILITLATMLQGFNGAGFNKCATLVSRQHSHFVLAIIQFLWCIAMLISPIMITALLPTGSASEWHVVFIVHTAILFQCNAVFCCLATAKPAPWTDSSITHFSRKNTPIFIS